MQYSAYLQTEHWRHVRKRIFRQRGRRCQLCNQAGPVEVHHNNYDRLWNEDDTDLIILCPTCHARHHDALRIPECVPEAGESFWPEVAMEDGTVRQGPLADVVRRWKTEIKAREIPRILEERGQEEAQRIYDLLNQEPYPIKDL